MPTLVRTLTVVSCLALLQPMLIARTDGESASLSVTSVLPPAGGVDFSVGAPVTLMRGSFREALRKSGISLANWTAACRTGEPLCPQGLQAAEPLVVNAKTFAVSVLIVAVASLGTGALLYRRLSRLDLVAVLKTRE